MVRQTIGCVCSFLVDNQKDARNLCTARHLDHRSTKCCLCWLLITVWSVRFFDTSRTFLHTPIKTRVFANPPEDYQSPIPGGVSEMTKTVYCLQEAPAEHSLYRTMVGKLMFIAAERPDFQFCVKECARGVQSPSARDMQRAKRICRYLMGTRDWTLKLEPWKDVDTLQMMVDSDWATDKVDRRSTSAGVAQLGGCTIFTYSRTQGSPAMSSAEAEGYALGSGACEGLFICAVAKELGVELKLALHSDSTATISQHTKMGLGRMKHVELRFLFVKDLLKRERFVLRKIPGTENPADLGTKVLDVNTHRHTCARSLVWGLLNRQWRRSRVT